MHGGVTYSNGVAEHFLTGIYGVLEHVMPRGEGTQIRRRASRVSTVNDIALYHTIAVHRCGLVSTCTMSRWRKHVQTWMAAMMNIAMPM